VSLVVIEVGDCRCDCGGDCYGDDGVKKVVTVVIVVARGWFLWILI